MTSVTDYIHQNLDNILLEEYVPKEISLEMGNIFGRLIAGGTSIKNIANEIDALYKKHKVDDAMKHAIKTRVKFLSTSMDII